MMDSEDVHFLLNSLNSLSYHFVSNKPACIKILNNLIYLSKNDIQRKIIQSHHGILLELIRSGSCFMTESLTNDEDWKIITHLCQLLRNSCIGVKNDAVSFNCCELVAAGVDILLPLIENRANARINETAAIRSCLQFFGNIVVQCNSSKLFVWTLFMESDLFFKLLNDKDAKVKEFSMMILYNCMIPDGFNPQLLKALTDALIIDIVDWGILSLEVCLSYETFLTCYNDLPLQNRFVILDLVAEKLESAEKDGFIMNEATLVGLRTCFIQDVMDIVKICDSQSGDLKSIEITKLLSVLCSASASDRNRLLLKPFKELLEVSIDCLKTVHLLGKQSANIFSSVPNDLQTNTEECDYHPIFCFKKNLVRLIGNLCFENKENQDLVRHLDAIPLIMDCCKLDKRNPYMIQWCVLAIRNILENNSENQHVLAGISVAEGMEKSRLFQELGLTVEMENGRPVLRPVRKESL